MKILFVLCFIFNFICNYVIIEKNDDIVPSPSPYIQPKRSPIPPQQKFTDTIEPPPFTKRIIRPPRKVVRPLPPVKK